LGGIGQFRQQVRQPLIAVAVRHDFRLVRCH
jgi:hypothetical protein